MVASSSDDFNQRLQRLAQEAQQHPPLSYQRQLALNKLINEIVRSRQLKHPQRGSLPPSVYEDLYHEALQKTWLYICERIENYRPEHPVMAWVNNLLNFQFIAVVKEYNNRQLVSLPSLENFLQYLNQIKQPESVKLINWFEGIIEAGWLTLEELLNLEQDTLTLMYRDPINITRGQQIDLGLEVAEQPFALVVTLPQNVDSEVEIRVQVYPLGDHTYLPQGVKLMVMDESGEVVLDTESREADNFIQLGFSAELGEHFSVTVALGEANVRQDFVI